MPAETIQYFTGSYPKFTHAIKDGAEAWDGLDVTCIIKRLSDDKYWKQSTETWESSSIENDMTEIDATGIYCLDTSVEFIDKEIANKNDSGFLVSVFAKESSTPVYNQHEIVFIRKGTPCPAVLIDTELSLTDNSSDDGTYEYENTLFRCSSGDPIIKVYGDGNTTLRFHNCGGYLVVKNYKTGGTLSLLFHNFNGRLYTDGACTINSYGGVNKFEHSVAPTLNKSDDLQSIKTTMALDSTVAKQASLLDAQDIRDAMKLAPSAGDPASGSVDAELDSLYDSAGLILTDTNAIKGDVDDIPSINNNVIDIKTKTDQLNFTNANKVDAASLITTPPTDMALESTAINNADIIGAAVFNRPTLTQIEASSVLAKEATLEDIIFYAQILGYSIEYDFVSYSKAVMLFYSESRPFTGNPKKWCYLYNSVGGNPLSTAAIAKRDAIIDWSVEEPS